MQEERKMILKMIEDGKITAEEGLALLKELGNNEEKTEKKQEQQSYLTNDVDWSEQNRYEHHGKYKQPSFTNRFADFLEQTIQKIKDLDMDFNFGHSVEIDHIFQHNASNVTVANIAVENGSVHFAPWDEQDVRVECKVKVYREKEVEAARKQFLDEVTFHVSDEKLRFKCRDKALKVNATIYIPRKSYEEVSLYTFNGKLTGETIEAEELKAQTVNGTITFDAIFGKEVALETVNGSITVKKLITDKAEAKTVNGTIAIDSEKGNSVIETLNGTIKYKLLKEEKVKAYLKTTTGSIEITVPENMKTEADFRTVVGGFTCDLPKMQVVDEKKDIINKSVTFIANPGVEPTFYVEAEARTGSILIQN